MGQDGAENYPTWTAEASRPDENTIGRHTLTLIDENVVQVPLADDANSTVGRSSKQSDGINFFEIASRDSTGKTRELKGLAAKNGEVGIRTRDTGLTPYNGLANRSASAASDVPAVSYDHDQNCLSPDLSMIVSQYPELTVLIRIWPKVPEALRTGILAITNSVIHKQ